MTKKRFESQDNIILDAEGESLKSIDEIVDVLNELDGENDFLYDNLIKFEKENEQLKKDVMYWKRYWKQVVSLYNNELNVFEHCKEYKSKCKDIDWSSELMTEKRFRTGKGIFEEGYPSEAIIDTKTGKVYYKGYANYASSKEICDLLNQKEKRIEELEHQLHSLTGLWASDKEDMSYPFRLEFKECENNE